MAELQNDIRKLFETISDSVLNGSIDLDTVRAECEKLTDLAVQINENRDSAKIKQIETAIEELNKLKQNIGKDTPSKPLDDAVQKYKTELAALKQPFKKAVAAPPKDSVWKQQLGKKKVEEGTVVLQSGYYGLGNGIEIECYPVEDDQSAPSGIICKRKNGTLFVIINHQLLEIPQCYFNVRGDYESDEYTNEGTKFYNADRDGGSSENPSKYADATCPEGNAHHVPHQVNKDGPYRPIRKPKTASPDSALAERSGRMSSAMIDVFSALNVKAKKNTKTK